MKQTTFNAVTERDVLVLEEGTTTCKSEKTEEGPFSNVAYQMLIFERVSFCLGCFQ